MQSSSRNGAKVIWLAVHTTEGIMRAADLLAWTAWAGSSHASNDETGVLLTPADGFVPYDRAAWTLRNANPISDNIEQCGRARWTRAEWLARPKLLDTTARWLADRHLAQPWIPLRRLTAAEIRARAPGVLGHGDYSAATGDGTHTDPGPNYPWDVVLDKARAYASGSAAPTLQEEDDEMPRFDLIRNKDTGAMVLAAPGVWSHIPDANYLTLYAGRGLIADTVPDIDVAGNEFDHFRSIYMAGEGQVVALTAAVKALSQNADITPEEIEVAVAKALRENVVTVSVDVAPGARTAP